MAIGYIKVDGKLITKNGKLIKVETDGAVNKIPEEKTVTPSTTQQEITPTDSSHELSKVTVRAVDPSDYSKEELETTINPSKNLQIVEAPEGKVFNKITVNKVTSDIDPNIIPENIKVNTAILGVVGTLDVGIVPSGTVEITENGKYDITDDAYVNVNVPTGITPNGTMDITTNGTHNVTNYEFANVNIESNYDINYDDTTKTLTINTDDSGNSSSGSNKYSSVIDRSITELTAEDFNGVTKIGNYAFAGSSSLTTVTIPSTITEIGNSAFYECLNMTNLQLLEGLQRIGQNAFYANNKITSVILPSTLTAIDYHAFWGCNNLVEVTILATTPPTAGVSPFSTNNVEKIYIPAGTLSVYQNASGWSAYSDIFVELSE